MNVLRLFRSKFLVNYGIGYFETNPLLKKVCVSHQLGILGHHCSPGGNEHGDDSSLEETLRVKEAPALDPEWATADCKKLEALVRSAGTIPIPLTSPESVATTNGVPFSPSYGTAIYIRRSAKYATMSGTGHTNHWIASRDPDKTWTEPMMDWTSSSDPYASMPPLVFPDEASAINFCEKNGYSWYIQRQPPRPMRNPIIRRYENNFHWNKRCRVSTR